MVVVSSLYNHWMSRYSTNINNSAFNIYVTAPITVSLNISASSGRRKMKPPPFDAARRDGSNELRYILLRPLDAEIIDECAFYFLISTCQNIFGISTYYGATLYIIIPDLFFCVKVKSIYAHSQFGV